jgi:AAA+ superfamily predicted ATPase
MRMPLDITFGWSSSPNYPSAVQLAQSLPGYSTSGAGKGLLHRVQTAVSLAQDNAWENLQALLQLVAAWRSTRLRLAGQAVPFWQLSFQVAQVQACYARKLKLHAGPGYCSGQQAPDDEASHFGCRLTKGVSRKLRPWSPSENSWIRFGTLSAQRDRFRVDKEAIFQALQAENQRQACIYCPAFRWSQVRNQVDRLPDELPLGPDSPFELKYSDLNRKQPVGIRLKISSGQDSLCLSPGPGPASREPAQPAPRRQVPNVRYADVAGQDAALAAVRHVVELPLAHPEYFQSLGVQPQRGILLYGPSGNGKTLLAQAVASQSQAHFEIINGPEILSKWVGQGEARLRQVFHRARQLAPSLVLIDELDSIAPRREGLCQQHDVQILAQLLVLLDGLEERGQVAVIAATNRLEAIDPALCRPGRFDYHVEVPLPDARGRLAILRVHLAKLQLASALDMAWLVEQTAGYSGAELAALCREAGLVAVLRGIAAKIGPSRLRVSPVDLQQALHAWRGRRTLAPEATYWPLVGRLLDSSKRPKPCGRA